MEKGKDLANCNFVKVTLMLLVILGHACNFWAGRWFTGNPVFECKGLGIISSWLNSFHIYAFALVSGYIFAFKNLEGGYSHYGLFLKNKVKRLLVPYVFVMLIWVAPISAYYFKSSATELFRQYVLCINPSQLWFLWMLFGVFVIVWPFKKDMLEKPITGWMISILFYGIGLVGGRFIPNVFCVWTACQYVIFFYIGMRIRTKSEKKERLVTEAIPWYGWIIAHIILFVASRLIGIYDGFLWRITSIGMGFLLHVIGAIMAWTVLQTLASRVHWQDRKVFKTLASSSMPMYLFHQQIIYFTISALNGVVNPWINAGVNFIVAIAGSLIISVILMRWKFTSVMTR